MIKKKEGGGGHTIILHLLYRNIEVKPVLFLLARKQTKTRPLELCCSEVPNVCLSGDCFHLLPLCYNIALSRLDWNI